MTAVAAVVRDVFRQARATGLTATLLSSTVVATMACLTAHFSPTNADAGTLTILGGVQVVDGVPHDVAIRYLQFLLSGVIADTLGVLLALVWTAGFLPSFIEPVAVSVLLVKPPRRATLFLARFAGVALFVGVQAALFVAATGLALGVRTGVWGGGYWLSVPLLLAQFAVFYSFSALLAVATKNAAGCLVGTLLFWLLCWAMNYGRHALAGLQLTEATPELLRTADLVYWVLPKPADFSLILYDALDADRFTTPWVEFRRVQDAGLFHPLRSVASSLTVGALLLALAVYEFVHDDY
jgi:ABC-type transport system involved in multi-copper enzyme maturation permease subunit